MTKKFILDACCGGRMFWFNKNHPNALYIDKRERQEGFIKQRPAFSVKPDEIGDFTKLRFKDKSFKLVVWDPPHTIRACREGKEESGIIAKRYGRLRSETWKEVLSNGFKECWRVLEDYGIMIFKWGAPDKKISDVLSLFSQQPLFGHTTSNKGNTHWMCFMKIPKK